VDVVSHRTQDFPEPLGGDLHAFFGMLMIISVPIRLPTGARHESGRAECRVPEDGAWCLAPAVSKRRTAEAISIGPAAGTPHFFKAARRVSAETRPGKVGAENCFPVERTRFPDQDRATERTQSHACAASACSGREERCCWRSPGAAYFADPDLVGDGRTRGARTWPTLKQSLPRSEPKHSLGRPFRWRDDGGIYHRLSLILFR